MDCNGSSHIVGLVTSQSLLNMHNQNKKQTNRLFALLFNKIISLCIKLHICCNTNDVIVLITKN